MLEEPIFIAQQLSITSFSNVMFFTTAFLTILASIIAFHFFKLYRIAGLRNLLGMPVGFAFLAASYTLVNINLWINDATELDSTVVWISSIILSYGFSLIAISYHYKSSDFSDSARLIKAMSLSLIPLMAVSFIFVLSTPARELIPFQTIDEYFDLFNTVALGYVLVKSLGVICREGNPRTLLIPASFGLLLMGQILMYMWAVSLHVDNIAYPMFASLAGLALFTYTLYHYVIRSDRIVKRTAT